MKTPKKILCAKCLKPFVQGGVCPDNNPHQRYFGRGRCMCCGNTYQPKEGSGHNDPCRYQPRPDCSWHEHGRDGMQFTTIETFWMTLAQLCPSPFVQYKIMEKHRVYHHDSSEGLDLWCAEIIRNSANFLTYAIESLQNSHSSILLRFVVLNGSTDQIEQVAHSWVSQTAPQTSCNNYKPHIVLDWDVLTLMSNYKWGCDQLSTWLKKDVLEGRIKTDIKCLLQSVAQPDPVKALLFRMKIAGGSYFNLIDPEKEMLARNPAYMREFEEQASWNILTQNESFVSEHGSLELLEKCVTYFEKQPQPLECYPIALMATKLASRLATSLPFSLHNRILALPDYSCEYGERGEFSHYNKEQSFDDLRQAVSTR